MKTKDQKRQSDEREAKKKERSENKDASARYRH